MTTESTRARATASVDKKLAAMTQELATRMDYDKIIFELCYQQEERIAELEKENTPRWKSAITGELLTTMDWQAELQERYGRLDLKNMQLEATITHLQSELEEANGKWQTGAPPTNGIYLVASEYHENQELNNAVSVDHWDGHTWAEHWPTSHYQVTHWMPVALHPRKATGTRVQRMGNHPAPHTREGENVSKDNVGEFLIWKIVCMNCGQEWHGTSDNKEAWCRCICARCDGDTFQVQFKNKYRQEQNNPTAR